MELVLSKLSDAKPNGAGWLACCPAHEDRSPSLSIGEGDDRRVLLKCFAGCSHEAIVEALGLESKDLFVPRPDCGGTQSGTPASNKKSSSTKSAAKPKGIRFETAGAAVSSLTSKMGRASGQWTYHDADGKPVALVLRFNRDDGSKEFRPVSLHDDGGWYVAAPKTPRPLYNLPEIATAQTVFVCEGEKAGDAIRSLGLVAVTSMNGSQSPELSDWMPLVGKLVVILPDNDEPGRKYADAVVDILQRLDSKSRIKIVDLPDLPPKGDAVEWLDSFGDAAEPDAMRNELLRLVDEADFIEADPVEVADSTRFEPFPVDALPDVVRDFVVAGAKALGVDPAFIALPVLSMLGSCIGNTRRLSLKRGWTEPPIVWSVIIGNSGACKSPALELALKPLKDRQRDAFKEHAEAMRDFEDRKTAYDRAVDQWKKAKTNEPVPEKPLEPIAERFVADDTTVESLAALLLNQPRGLLVSRDELAGWLGSFDRYSSGKGGDVAKWLEMFGGRSITIDRKTGLPKTIFIPRAAVCLTGGIQPETLKRCLVQSHVENGLAARLLFASPPARPRRWTDAVVDEKTENAFADVVDRLLGLQFDVTTFGDIEPKLLTLSLEARDRFKQFVDEQGAEHTELSDDLSAAWSKLEGYAARLALILHLAKVATGHADEAVVDLESIEAGIRFSRWFGHEAKRIYAMLGESPDDTAQRKLIDWIERKGGSVTPREVKQGNRCFHSTDQAEAALNELTKTNAGRWELTPTTSKGGRTSRRFTLSTPSTSTKPP